MKFFENSHFFSEYSFFMLTVMLFYVISLYFIFRAFVCTSTLSNSVFIDFYKYLPHTVPLWILALPNTSTSVSAGSCTSTLS